MIRVGIAGASGYTGSELIRILWNHPEVEITALTSEKQAGLPISETFPSLKGIVDIQCESLSHCDLAGKCDLIFSALPHREGLEVVGGLVKAGKKVIDLSADFRLADYKTYEKWYGVTHTQRDLLPKAVYGMPEIKRDQISNAQLVANPGCFPTGAMLGLAPVLKSGWVETSGIIIDSKTGVSGAGRNAGLPFLYPECNEGVKAYNISAHRHTPEMEQELSGIAGKEVCVTFSPHLIPANRGILSTIYCQMAQNKDLGQVWELYYREYAEEPFLRLLKQGNLANTKFVLGTNYCDIGLVKDERNNRLVITTAIDNLVKGASGLAVQNMNIMFGFLENTGLKGPGLYP